MLRCRWVVGVLLMLLAPLSVEAQTQTWCGDLPRQALDYMDPEQRARFIGMVESFHFTDDVRSLRRGATGYIENDLDYVLNYYPNHHAALDALSRLAVREGSPQPGRARHNIECRFQWAEQVNPRDAMVPLIQGLYYHRLGQNDTAREHLQRAVQLAPNSPEVQYNLGLVLFRLGDYTAARTHARRAYSLGYPLPGLRNLLADAGYPL